MQKIVLLGKQFKGMYKGYLFQTSMSIARISSCSTNGLTFSATKFKWSG